MIVVLPLLAAVTAIIAGLFPVLVRNVPSLWDTVNQQAGLTHMLGRLRKDVDAAGGLPLSAAGRTEILDLHEHVADYVRLISQAVEEGNAEIVSKASTRGDMITHLVRQCRTKHLERVEAGQISPLKSLIFTDMLTSYRRIKDHALNIAESLAGEK